MTLVWITGIGGFVGAHLARHLVRRGTPFAGIAHRRAVSFGPDVAVEMGGVTTESCARLLARTGPPTAIIHLGGPSSPRPTLDDPLDDFDNSLSAAAALFVFVLRNCPETKLVVASTAAVYGDGHDVSIDESADLRPASPYGAHKRAVEALALDYGRIYGLRSIVLRIFSLYGPGLRRQIVWDICRRLAAGVNPVILSGTGEEARDYLHIDDLVPLLVESASHASPKRPLFNVGSGQGRTMRALAETIAGAWAGPGQEPPRIVFSGVARPGDPHALVAAIGRLRLRMEFAPSVSFEKGIADTVRWFRSDHAPLLEPDAAGFAPAGASFPVAIGQSHRQHEAGGIVSS